MITQIYSIQTVEEAVMCAKAGADRIGVAVATGANLPAEVSVEQCREIFNVVRGKCETVLIVVTDDGEDVFPPMKELSPDVIHICGKGKTDPAYNNKPGYVQYEYIKKELTDVFALADIVISRAGANAICELHALRKPHILIPLPLKASRGDQILNARSFEKSGFSKVLMEEDITDNVLVDAIHEVMRDKDKYIEAMSRDKEADSITLITGIIDSLVKE